MPNDFDERQNMNNNFDNNGYRPQPEVKRNYTPEEAGHGTYRKPISRKRKYRRNGVNLGVIIIAIVFALIAFACIYVIGSGNRENIEFPITDETETEIFTVVETEPPKEITVTVTEEQMHMGDLILVNYAYPYAFAESEVNDVVNVKENMNEYYLVSKAGHSLRSHIVDICNTMFSDMFAANGCRYMQVNSAYRSYDDQVATYEYYKEARGEEYAKEYVANPGNSEHHTGLALDLNVNLNGAIYYVESYEDCAWFREKCQDYGFVLRYPAEKKYITGISGETWHYRYVGTPHAALMNGLDYCLEEYIDYLKSYTYETAVMYYEDGIITKAPADPEWESGYMIYYVPSAGDITEITVPNFCEYEISGNNVDGFVVTVKK